MNEELIKTFRVTLAHICIDIAQTTEFNCGHGTALHIALISRQLQNRMRASFLKSCVRSRVPCEDRGRAKRHGQIFHVFHEFLGDIDVIFALIVAMKIEHNVVF